MECSRPRDLAGGPRARLIVWNALGAFWHAQAALRFSDARARAEHCLASCWLGADSWSGRDAEPWTVAGLEAAYSALASRDPSAALTESQSLAAARQRALKAAALPPLHFRSHAGGVSLSPGAADVAARCAGARCARVRRFVLAAGEAARLADGGGCAVQHCPDALGVGRRPLPYTPHAFGNRCEPPWNRGALEAVRQLVAPGWRVLEWGTGGSTTWFLARLAMVTSVEGAAGEPCPRAYVPAWAGSGVQHPHRADPVGRGPARLVYCFALHCGQGLRPAVVPRSPRLAAQSRLAPHLNVCCFCAAPPVAGHSPLLFVHALQPCAAHG